MLVSHRKQFIYTKTLKTGGTSVESYFEPFCMNEGEWVLSHPRDQYVSDAGIIGYRGRSIPVGCAWWNHMPAARIKSMIGEEIWSSYYKFCVIRNPFDKAISAFYDSTRNTRYVNMNDLQKERSDFEAWLRFPGPPTDSDKYLINCEFCLDDVIRFESLTDDMQRISAQLDILWNPYNLPYFKKGRRPHKATAECLYSKKSKRLVEDVYSFELDYFNYSFPQQ